jgi:hypothetical protein
VLTGMSGSGREALFYASTTNSRRNAALSLILYQRDDCQLCDLALALLAQVRAPEFDSVFIDDDPKLETRYGERVPVLRDTRGRELDWPFGEQRLRAWFLE